MNIGDRQGLILRAMRDNDGIVTPAMAADAWGFDLESEDTYGKRVIRRAVNETLHRMVMRKRLVHPARGIYAQSYHHYAVFRLRDPEWLVKVSDIEIADMRAVAAETPAKPMDEQHPDLFE